MAPAITDVSLAGIITVPVSVPQVVVSAQQPAIPLAQITLAANQVMSVPFLTLHLIQYLTLGFTDKRNTGLPILYVGLYYQNGPVAGNVGARPILHIGRDVPGVSMMPRMNSVTFHEPGIYRFLLVNNHMSSDISALVTGMVIVSNVTNIG